jgi:predicted GNAT family N-acyltransferase
MEKVYLNAQLHARAFYERLGFSPYGDVFLEANIEHIGMARRP